MIFEFVVVQLERGRDRRRDSAARVHLKYLFADPHSFFNCEDLQAVCVRYEERVGVSGKRRWLASRGLVHLRAAPKGERKQKNDEDYDNFDILLVNEISLSVSHLRGCESDWP
jgi:hypothetical protein